MLNSTNLLELMIYHNMFVWEQITVILQTMWALGHMTQALLKQQNFCRPLKLVFFTYRYIYVQLYYELHLLGNSHNHSSDAMNIIKIEPLT